jgi:hypothetical protein
MCGARKWLGLIPTVALLLIATSLATAGIPHKINYQGRVTHIASGVPLPGTHSMIFRIYDVQMGGLPLWEETQTVEADFQGVVSTILGEVVPIDLTFEGPYWLEVVVDGETLTPRREMVSSGYAYNAERSHDSERLGGLESSSYSLVDHSHHSLDAADGDPADVVYVDNNGNVGVGTTGPYHLLDVVNHSGANFTRAISGVTYATGDGQQIWGIYGRTTSDSEINAGAGVIGVASSATGNSSGVRGEASGIGAKAVWGWATNPSGLNYGVYGTTQSQSGWAGYFSGGQGIYVSGNAQVSGTLSKGGGSFKIDHPLDPENKYLYHSFVESPDMMNIYNGNAVLDASGEAWVELPEWFESLNFDFRYQLTAIGGASPNLHIASEIEGNRFLIAGGGPGMKVSWQVTGVRQDPFAQANRIPVEEDKSAEERGKYLHPEAYSVPATMGIDYQDPAMHRMVTE